MISAYMLLYYHVHTDFETSYTPSYSELSTSTHALLHPVRQQHNGETDRTTGHTGFFHVPLPMSKSSKRIHWPDVCTNDNGTNTGRSDEKLIYTYTAQC